MLQGRRVLWLLSVAALAAGGCSAAPMDGGDESIESVGETQQALVTTITTLAQLRAMTATGNYELGGNIDASATATTPFVPVGTFAAPFKGTFDGKGFTIDKLTVKANGFYVGMFSITSGATLQNIKLTNVKVPNTSANGFTGAIVGLMGGGSLSNSQVSGLVTGGSATGGLVGGANGASLVGCAASSLAVTGTTSTGGLVGQLTLSSTVINSSSTGGSVTGTDGVGGLVGSASASGVSFCSATGLNVNGTTNTGGAVGSSTASGLSYDSVSGSVKGTTHTGGLVGSMSDANVFFGSATNMTVTANANTGGLVGLLTRSTISYSNVSGSIVGTARTGGLVGNMIGSATSRAAIDMSYVDDKSANNPSTVQGGTPVGMAVGLARTYCDFSRSYAIGKLTGASTKLGGFIGEVNAPGPTDVNNNVVANITEIFTKVEINPTFDSGSTPVYAGGLVGHLLGGAIEDINVAGSVKGRTYVGGAIGFAVNEGANVPRSFIRDTLVRGEITNVATSGRSGVVGGDLGHFSYCTYNYWDSTTDTGSAPPLDPDDDATCQLGRTAAQLKAPEKKYVDPSHPNGNYDIFVHGLLYTKANQAELGFPNCALGSGSDGDFGMGMCYDIEPYYPPPVWLLNAGTEYNTLVNIPNASRQPKN